VLSLRVSRDKRGYDYIYLLLEARRRGRVENRLLYCGRWPTPCRVGSRPFDDETRIRLEEAHPDVAFDWPTLLKTLQAALGVSRPAPSGPPPPPSSSSQRSRRPERPGDRADRGDRDRAGGPPTAYGGRPGQPRRPGGPGSPRPSEPVPLEPIEAMEPMEPETEAEPDYVSTEVVLVSAEIEERESSYVAPEFEAIHEVEQTFAASFEVELASEGTVEIPVPEATEPRTAVSVEGHTFAPAGDDLRGDEAVAADEIDDTDEDDADGADEGDEDGDAEEERGRGAGAAGGAAESGGADVAAQAGRPAEVGPAGAGVNADSDPNRPRRRRRRRGGRGRGKPPETRQGSE
jgi:ribonuclease E